MNTDQAGTLIRLPINSISAIGTVEIFMEHIQSGCAALIVFGYVGGKVN
jgi:hypothetical protein